TSEIRTRFRHADRRIASSVQRALTSSPGSLCTPRRSDGEITRQALLNSPKSNAPDGRAGAAFQRVRCGPVPEKHSGAFFLLDIIAPVHLHLPPARLAIHDQEYLLFPFDLPATAGSASVRHSARARHKSHEAAPRQ